MKRGISILLALGLILGSFATAFADPATTDIKFEGEEIRLSVEDSVLPVLYIRTCTGVLGDNVSSLTVPEKAIYTQDNMPGVVVVNGEYQIFIPVNVLDRRDGMAFISPIQQGQLYEGQTVRLF